MLCAPKKKVVLSATEVLKLFKMNGEMVQVRGYLEDGRMKVEMGSQCIKDKQMWNMLNTVTQRNFKEFLRNMFAAHPEIFVLNESLDLILCCEKAENAVGDDSDEWLEEPQQGSPPKTRSYFERMQISVHVQNSPTWCQEMQSRFADRLSAEY